MIDVSELIDDPDFAQEFTVYRTTGDFVGGRWVEEPKQTILMTGVIVPMSPKALQQLPEADRVQGSIEVFTKEALYMTSGAGTVKKSSDQILWKGFLYKLNNDSDYTDYGFYKAIGQRISGE